MFFCVTTTILPSRYVKNDKNWNRLVRILIAQSLNLHKHNSICCLGLELIIQKLWN